MSTEYSKNKIIDTIFRNCDFLEDNYNLEELQELSYYAGLLTDENKKDKELLCSTLSVHYNINVEEEKLLRFMEGLGMGKDETFGFKTDIGIGREAAKLIREYTRFSGTLKQTLLNDDWVSNLTVLPTGELVSSSGKTIKIWERNRIGNYMHKQTITECINRYTDLVKALTVLPTGELVSGSQDNIIKIWEKDDEDSYIIKQTIKINIKARSRPDLNTLTTLPTGEIISNEGSIIRIWDKKEGKYILKQSITWKQGGGHFNIVYSLSTLKDGKFVSGDDDGTIKIWEKNNEGKYVLKQSIENAHGQPDEETGIEVLTVLPTGELVSGSWDRTIKIWEKNNEGKYVLKQRIKNDSQVLTLTILTNGDIVSGSQNNMIKIWEKNNVGKYVFKRSIENVHNTEVRCLTNSSTGELISSGDDNTIKIWE